MIHLSKLVLNNFMSYEGKHVIQLANQGIVRIEGVNEDDPSADSNMSGKSTIIEAVLWCFFGRTLRGLKHGRVINRRARKNCFVAQSFRVSGTLYVCRRNRRHSKYGNKLILYRKGMSISSRHDADTQTRLENILDCDYEGFVNSVVFGGFDSGTRKQFALQTDAQQKQVLDSFLKFEKFEIALRRTKYEIRRTEELLSRVGLSNARYIERVSSSRRSLSEIRKRDEQFKKARSFEAQALREEIKRIEQNSGRGVRRTIEKVSNRIEKTIGQKAGVEERLSRIQRQLQILVEKQLNKEKMIGEPCPACGREVKEDTLSSLLKHLAREKHKLKMEKRVAVKTAAKLERRLIDGRKVLKRLQEKQNTYIALREKKNSLEERLRSQAETSSFNLERELEQASKQYSKNLSRLLALKYQEQALRSRIKDLEFWETGFGNRGVKALIVREALPAMNAKLREYAQELFEGNAELEFKASKQTDRGNERELFNLSYRTKRNADSYTAESSGGRRRVDICVLLVFSWLSRICNCIFCDELLDGLDASGRETVLSILSKQRGTVFVVSHNRELKSRIGTVWTVRKRNGVSRLETQSA